MTITNQDLVDRFHDGEESGVANNMEIAQMPGGGTAVIGYGHAVYAYRPPDDRFGPLVFTGWRDASKTSREHINMLGSREHIAVSGRAKKTDVYGDPDYEVLKEVKDEDKDYSTAHRRYERGGGD
jgi:hypothetical protein